MLSSDAGCVCFKDYIILAVAKDFPSIFDDSQFDNSSA